MLAAPLQRENANGAGCFKYHQCIEHEEEYISWCGVELQRPGSSQERDEDRDDEDEEER